MACGPVTWTRSYLAVIADLGCRARPVLGDHQPRWQVLGGRAPVRSARACRPGGSAVTAELVSQPAGDLAVASEDQREVALIREQPQLGAGDGIGKPAPVSGRHRQV